MTRHYIVHEYKWEDRITTHFAAEKLFGKREFIDILQKAKAKTIAESPNEAFGTLDDFLENEAFLSALDVSGVEPVDVEFSVQYSRGFMCQPDKEDD